METDQYKWRIWADFLQRWRIRELAVSLLESMGPFTILGAQLIYITQPFLPQSLTNHHLDELTRLLEDNNQVQAFVNYLSEESTE